MAGANCVVGDRLGRLPVDDYLKVEGVADVFAAGDMEAAKMDDERLSVMSGQHGPAYQKGQLHA